MKDLMAPGCIEWDTEVLENIFAQKRQLISLKIKSLDMTKELAKIFQLISLGD